MRRWWTAMGLTAAGAAAAGGFSAGGYTMAKDAPGVVIFDVHKAEACEGVDPWTPEAMAWVDAEHALAVRLDWAKDGVQIKELAGKGTVTAPMRVVRKDGVEIDRVCGCLDAPTLQAWLGGVTRGTTRADATRAGLTGDWSKDVTAALDLVQQDYCAGRDAQALETLIGLWNGLDRKDQGLRDLRFVRVGRDMAVLARRSPEVTEKLAALRDSIAVAKDTDQDLLDDWVALNRILLQDGQTVAWLDAHRTDPAFSSLISHQAPNLVALLIDAERWADAGNLIGDAAKWLEWCKPTKGGLALAIDSWVSLSAAARDKDAERFAADLLKSAPAGTACTMIDKATAAGQARTGQKKVAKACEDAAAVSRWEAAAK